MRKTREILRLRWGLGLAGRAVGRSVRCSSSTVSDCVARAQAAGLSWPLPDELTDEQLEQRLYPVKQSENPRPDLDYRKRFMSSVCFWPHLCLQSAEHETKAQRA